MKGFFYTLLFDICRCVFPPLFLYPFEKGYKRPSQFLQTPPPPIQTMDARRVLYCCSVGRASFVTIRHIPFRFRTARSTNNNNKKSAGYIWTKWLSSHACMLPLAATNSPGLSFLSLSPVGSDTVKNRCRAVGIAPTLSLSLAEQRLKYKTHIQDDSRRT